MDAFFESPKHGSNSNSGAGGQGMNESMTENVEASGQIIGQAMEANVSTSIQFHDSNANSESTQNILPISDNLILTENTDMSSMQANKLVLLIYCFDNHNCSY